MKCPKCGKIRTDRVMDSYNGRGEKADTVIRRRKCGACGQWWMTEEKCVLKYTRRSYPEHLKRPDLSKGGFR